MSFLAKLFINNEERRIMDATQIFKQFADKNGRPASNISGKTLDIAIESTGNDALFYQHMFSPNSPIQGEIVFYRRDGISTMFRLEFANAYLVRLSENFSSTSTSPLHLRLSIAWGIIRMRDIIHEEYWNPNNPFVDIEPTVLEEEEGELVSSYYEDMHGNETDKLKVGSSVYLVIQSKGAAGKTLKIDLSDNTKDFEHNGALLENDILEIPVSGDLQKIKLKVIAQHHL